MALWMIEKIIVSIFYPILNRRIARAEKAHDEPTILAALAVKQHMAMVRSALWEWRHGMEDYLLERLLGASQRGVN